jgi:predicted site-specific integrase-resolvase
MEKLLSLTEFAELVKYSRKTIFNKIKEGLIEPHEIRNGRNYFLPSQASIFRKLVKTKEKYSYGYYRVSSNTQKDHLLDQLKLIETYSASKGIILKESIKDIGSGMNMERKGFIRLIELILDDEVDQIVITYEDRLVRFGFDIIKLIANKFNTEIVVINAKTTSPEKELVEDLMTIIHVFSSRLYGLRSNKKKIKEITDDLCREDEV